MELIPGTVGCLLLVPNSQRACLIRLCFDFLSPCGCVCLQWDWLIQPLMSQDCWSSRTGQLETTSVRNCQRGREWWCNNINIHTHTDTCTDTYTHTHCTYIYTQNICLYTQIKCTIAVSLVVSCLLLIYSVIIIFFQVWGSLQCPASARLHQKRWQIQHGCQPPQLLCQAWPGPKDVQCLW